MAFELRFENKIQEKHDLILINNVWLCTFLSIKIRIDNRDNFFDKYFYEGQNMGLIFTLFLLTTFQIIAFGKW